MRILLHADSLIRDPGPMLVLAELLRRRGHDAVVSSRVTTHFYLYFWRPHYLIHSAPNAVAALIAKGLIAENGPRVAIIPQEGMERQDNTMHAFYEGILQSGIEKFIDQVFLWNTHQYEWLRDNSTLGEQRLSIVANVRLDLAKYGGNVRPRHGTVGFIGRFPILNKYDGSHIMCHLLADASDLPELARHNRLLNIATQVSSLAAYAEIIHHIMRHTDYRVSLRPHHEEAADNAGFRMLKRRYGNRIEIDRGLSIYDWALGVDAIVSTTSMTFAEAYLAGTPVICLDRMTESEENVDADEASITDSYADDLMPRNEAALYQVLAQCMNGKFTLGRNEKVEAIMREEFSWPYVGSALGQIADHVHAVSASCVARIPLAPKHVVELAYLPRIFQIGGMRPCWVVDKHYSRLFHGVPPFVTRVVENIATDAAGVARTQLASSTDLV
jgi:surface carbohydrate biosynthesis protein